MKRSSMGTNLLAHPEGPWDDDGKVHHGPETLPSGKNQTRHLDALDAADKTAVYEGGGGGGGATIIFRVGDPILLGRRNLTGAATYALNHSLTHLAGFRPVVLIFPPCLS